MDQLSLNDFYSEYLSGNISLTELEGAIYNYLFNNQEKTCLCHWKRDEFEDYISWFYPRLHKAIKSYQDIGASFEAFMARFLLISSKEYRVRITTNAITEYSAWSAQVPDMYVYEEPPVYKHKNNMESIVDNLTNDRSGRKNTRRLLALILKCYNYVSVDFAEKIAPKIGIKKEELLEMLSAIRAIRKERDDKIYFMKERIYTQFFRCLIYEKKLSLIKENTAAYNKLKHKHEKARGRLEKMRKRIAGVRTDATNKQISGIIGVSKGAVDSSLHKLKTKWEKMLKNSHLN